MPLYLDHKYAAQVGSRLERFKRKNQKTYNFRCPICGDSEKSKIKSRGYFYVKGNDIKFYCHNCLKSLPFGLFLKEFAGDLYEQYIFERYKNDDKKDEPNYSKFDFKPNFKHESLVPEYNSIFDDCFSINDLPNNHYAKEYISKRKIPKKFWRDIFFVPDFKALVDKVEPENEYGLKQGDPRIVFPFRDKEKRITAFQGRSFEKGGLRYITIKVFKDSPKIFGLDRVSTKNRIYIVEGPIDSFFLPNAIASAGSNLGSPDLSIYSDVVFIFDNEPRNKTIVKTMKQMADASKLICVWPESIKEKDINDMILSGKTSKEIKDIIDSNVYTGLSARIAINEWKKC